MSDYVQVFFKRLFDFFYFIGGPTLFESFVVDYYHLVAFCE